MLFDEDRFIRPNINTFLQQGAAEGGQIAGARYNEKDKNSDKERMMEFRAAQPTDLPQVEAVYQKIVAHMQRQGVLVWDEVYPRAVLGEDIAQGRLYILLDGAQITAAFALCEANEGARAVQWAQPQAKALYLDRLGVAVEHLRKGLGSAMLRRAAALARDRGAQALRLFVVESNRPAIRLYESCGFLRAAGVYEERIDEDLTLREWGFEQNLSL